MACFECPVAKETSVGASSVAILPSNHPNLEHEVIGEGQSICICPYNHAFSRRAEIKVADLMAFPFISHERNSPFGQRVQKVFDGSGETVKPVIKVGSPQNACAPVLAGAPELDACLARVRDEPQSQLTHTFVEGLKSVMVNQGHPSTLLVSEV